MKRAIAEWEKHECLMLSIPHEKTDWKPYLSDILAAYVKFANAVSKFEPLLFIAPNERDFAPFSQIKNARFFKCETNDTWIRDYGAIELCEDFKIKSLDFDFNAWGNKFQSSLDNSVNSRLFEGFFKTKLEKIDLILEGGSIDFNGTGTMLTTSKCLLNANRNANLSKNDLETRLKEIFNLSNIVWLDNGAIIGDDTDAHIDTLARFIDANTIAYSICEDEKDPHFTSLKAMEKELQSTDFRLLPLPLPKAKFYANRRLGATYANFVFVNDALIVPGYDDENDERVLEALKRALPKREIVQIPALAFLRQNGSLHCACMQRFLGERDEI